jgi:replication factor A1
MVERAEEIYQALLEAGISEETIKLQVKEKNTEFQGFMTKQAILYLIAKEHGINIITSENKEILNHITEEVIDYNDFAIRIAKVSSQMRNIVVAGRVTKIFPIREFVKKDGSSGFVGSFQICDQSECIKIVLWNEQTKVMESIYFKKGEIVQVIGGYSKKNRDENLELHLSKQGSIILAPKDVFLPEKIVPEKIANVPVSNITKNKKKKEQAVFSIRDLHNKEGFLRFISGKIHVESFKELTLKNGEKSFLLKFILSDDTGSIKVNVWGIKAIGCMKKIKDGDYVKIININIKFNSYSKEKELHFTKSSRLDVI